MFKEKLVSGGQLFPILINSSVIITKREYSGCISCGIYYRIIINARTYQKKDVKAEGNPSDA